MCDSGSISNLCDVGFGLLARGVSSTWQKLAQNLDKDLWSVGGNLDDNNLSYCENLLDEDFHHCRMLVSNPSEKDLDIDFDINLFEAIEELPEAGKHFSQPEELNSQPMEEAVNSENSTTEEVVSQNIHYPEVSHEYSESTTEVVASLSSSPSEGDSDDKDSDYEASESMVALAKKPNKILSAFLKECGRYLVRNLLLDSQNS